MNNNRIKQHLLYIECGKSENKISNDRWIHWLINDSCFFSYVCDCVVLFHFFILFYSSISYGHRLWMQEKNENWKWQNSEKRLIWCVHTYPRNIDEKRGEKVWNSNFKCRIYSRI